MKTKKREYLDTLTTWRACDIFRSGSQPSAYMTRMHVALHRLALRRKTGAAFLAGDMVRYLPDMGQTLGAGVVRAMTDGGQIVCHFPGDTIGLRLVTPTRVTRA